MSWVWKLACKFFKEISYNTAPIFSEANEIKNRLIHGWHTKVPTKTSSIFIYCLIRKRTFFFSPDLNIMVSFWLQIILLMFVLQSTFLMGVVVLLAAFLLWQFSPQVYCTNDLGLFFDRYSSICGWLHSTEKQIHCSNLEVSLSWPCSCSVAHTVFRNRFLSVKLPSYKLQLGYCLLC